MHKVVFFSFLLSFLSCSKLQESGTPHIFYPQSVLTEEGVVGKFYYHYFPHNPDAEASTNINYVLVKQAEGDAGVVVEKYDAGFQLSEYSEYHWEGAQLKMDSSIIFYGTNKIDTAFVEIISSDFRSWSNPIPPKGFEAIEDYDGDIYTVRENQTSLIDSLINEKKAQTHIGERSFYSHDRDTTFNFKFASTYVEGLGLFHSISSGQNGRSVLELVKLMSMDDFRQIRNHKKQRVAYIDPTKTRDDALYFELCGHEKAIADYYNSTPDVRYAGGKGEMMKIIRSKLVREKLNGESGYLTVRFVVNCNGEAGRYVIEQTSLNYTDHQFSRETIDHLYDITYGLKEWSPSVIRGEPRDSYVYLTYKLQNGVVTDVLP